jgi:hypothetical protein
MTTKTTTKPTGPNAWVVRRGTAFVVELQKRGRHTPAPFCGATQRAATAYARSLSRAYGSELIVQGRDGRIRIKDSHGNDPYPPSLMHARTAIPLGGRSRCAPASPLP